LNLLGKCLIECQSGSEQSKMGLMLNGIYLRECLPETRQMRLGLKTRQMSAESLLFLSLILKRGKGIQLHSGSGHHIVLLLLLFFLFTFMFVTKVLNLGISFPSGFVQLQSRKMGRGVLFALFYLYFVQLQSRKNELMELFHYEVGKKLEQI
jgi:hypothetical protein